MGSSIWNFCLGIFMIAISPCSAIILESLYWNASNTKFTPRQGLVLFPQIGDKMDIVCPRVGGSDVEGKAEFYRVYLVTQDKLARCSVDKSDTPLLNCDKPDRDVKFTFKFQEFSPNLWGLEFLKGMDYYITSTSTGSLQGLDNTNGGVCKAKSMKLILRVGQSASDPPSSPKVSPTRYPPKQPKSRGKDPSINNNDVKNNVEAKTEPEEGGEDSHATTVSEVGLFVGLASGGIVVIIIIIIAALLVVLWRCHQRHCHPEGRQSTSMSLNTLAGPKRGSGGSSGNNGSEPSDIVFPMRPSENMFCRHYERVSADYGHPLYLVQEMPAQSPTNIYYKV